MLTAVTALLSALVVVAGLALVARDLWLECPAAEHRGGAGGFRRWFLRGLGIPLAWWCAWHVVALVGPALGVTPLTPDLGGGPWASILSGTAVFAVLASLAWTAVTLGTLVPAVAGEIRRQDEFRQLAIFVGGGTLLLTGGAAFGRSWMLVSAVSAAGLWTLLRLALRLVHRPKVSYARAVARLKFGRYDEAEQEVIRQLEEKEDDYEGWMMLATLYAEQFGQLAEARRTVQELCAEAGLTPYQISHAFNRLADWQLARGNDPAAARAALEEIIGRCPDTPFARSAAQRIHWLPIDDAELREQRQPRTLRLSALNQSMLAATSTDSAAVQLAEARTEAGQLADRLVHRPDDLATRIRLARVLAERLQRVEEALVHLREARAVPGTLPAQHAEWLALEAAWELQVRHREPAGRALLVQLVREHPDTPQALAARRQLQLLEDAELKRNRPPAAPTPPPRIVVRLPEVPPP